MSASQVIQSIPLDKLVKSTANARKTPPSDAEQAELMASIAAHGLQQNLVVRRARKRGVFEVVAGGRRLDALKDLQAEGAVAADYSVPCQVRTKDAEEISLAENTVRAAMHPADEFEAFAKLVDKGQSVADIAQRFGTPEKHVRQRLKLGKVATRVQESYGASFDYSDAVVQAILARCTEVDTGARNPPGVPGRVGWSLGTNWTLYSAPR